MEDLTDWVQWIWNGLNWLWLNVIIGLILAIVILIVGYIVSKAVKWIVIKSLKKVRIDKIFEGTGLRESMWNLGFRSIADLFGLLVFWFVFLFFIAMSLSFLHFPEIAAFVTLILEYLPKIFGAVIIGIVGVWVGTWLGDRIKKPAKEANLPITVDTIAALVKWLIIFMAAVIALSLLGIDTTILVTTFVILIAAVGLAVAISFGLGGRDTAANLSAYAVTTRTLSVGDEIEVNEYKGRILDMTAHGITLETARKESVVIPNSVLVTSVIIKKGPR